MAKFGIKPGVKLDGLGIEMIGALPIICDSFMSAGHNAIITSGLEGEHMPGSLHYEGRALDFRTIAQGMGDGDIRDVAADIRGELGGDFDVVIERTHLHIEYDPKLTNA